MYVTGDGADDDDEFDSVPLGRCSAIYHYAAQQDDELSIEPGLLTPHVSIFCML